MNAKEYGELFEISVRGRLAEIFISTKRDPGTSLWELLRGIEEISLRDIAEISHELGYAPSISLSDTHDVAEMDTAAPEIRHDGQSAPGRTPAT